MPKLKLFVVFLTALLLMFAFTPVVSASVINFASGDGVGESNSVTGTNVVVTPHPYWGTIPGASWVSYANTGYGGFFPTNTTVGGTPTAIFWEEFTLPGTINAGSATFGADDTMSVVIKNSMYPGGHLLFAANPVQDNVCAAGPIACQQAEFQTINLTPYLSAGINTIEMQAFQVGSDVFGAVWAGSVESTVPEPGTYALFGAGLIGLAFLRRRVTRQQRE